MDARDFERLKKSLEDAVSYEKRQTPLPARTTKYVGAIKVEIREGESVAWSLQKQLESLEELDLSECGTYADTLKIIMDHLGQGDEGMAELMGIPVATLRTWKQGTRDLSGPSRRLFEIVFQYPNVMWDVVRRSEEAYA